ncbi:hypothetical protein SBOR_9767 [Sclerotinia borealis F-4128]|uniref:Uncharacterized protein n=1 Tax=Sclerotinia borealis (strain F-4128) TaxID=1432307 RepID=W9C4M6_SCLBF|nr:hypothetical protein SBOR_9767 [Sclerotinia borealis F-4128]
MPTCYYKSYYNCADYSDKKSDPRLCKSCITKVRLDRIEEYIIKGLLLPPDDPDPAFEWEILPNNRDIIITKNWKTGEIVTAEQIQAAKEWEDRNEKRSGEKKQKVYRKEKDGCLFYPVEDQEIRTQNLHKVCMNYNEKMPESSMAQDMRLARWMKQWNPKK